jgi:sulfur-carrier protein
MTDPVSITVQIPRELRSFCDGSATIALSAASVRGVLEELELRHPKIHRSLCDETGQLRRHIYLFVNASHMHERQGLETLLESGDMITILPAVSGG